MNAISVITAYLMTHECFCLFVNTESLHRIYIIGGNTGVTLATKSVDNIFVVILLLLRFNKHCTYYVLQKSGCYIRERLVHHK